MKFYQLQMVQRLDLFFNSFKTGSSVYEFTFEMSIPYFSRSVEGKVLCDDALLAATGNSIDLTIYSVTFDVSRVESFVFFPSFL